MRRKDERTAGEWQAGEKRTDADSQPADLQGEGAYGDEPHAPPEGEPDHLYGDVEADILRAELKTIVEQFAAQDQALKEAEERLLRARAEMDTMRRRMQGEVELARNEGVSSALSPSLSVFDDLERALAAAELTADPGSIVPGVRAVRDALLRNLAALNVKLVGQPGEPFDPNFHEALTVVPLRPGARPGTIDQVVEAGFVQGERLVRVARVTVFADQGR